jgi:transcriptional regulator with XRE-family HTH domain
MMISPDQSRGARGILQWQMVDLQKASGVATQTIVRFERGMRTVKPSTIERMAQAFTQAGIEFFDGRWVARRQLDDEEVQAA